MNMKNILIAAESVGGLPDITWPQAIVIVVIILVVGFFLLKD